MSQSAEPNPPSRRPLPDRPTTAVATEPQPSRTSRKGPKNSANASPPARARKRSIADRRAERRLVTLVRLPAKSHSLLTPGPRGGRFACVPRVPVLVSVILVLLLVEGPA